MLKLQIPVNSDGDLFEFDLSKDKVTIGRRHDNDIRIKETYVSAYHAELYRVDGEVFLRDRDSSNGTYLNGVRVRDRVKVSQGDILKFGSLKCYIAKVNAESKIPALALADEEEVTSSAVSLPSDLKNKTAAVSSRKELPSAPKPNAITSGVYTSKTPENDFERNTISESTAPVSTVSDESFMALTEELEQMKAQLSANKEDLKKAKTELSTISKELVSTKEKAAKEDAAKIEKIADLEKQLKSNDTGSDELKHRLRLATSKVEQLESELDHHKTDMSVEIKAAMQRLTHTKNDNLLLQNTMDALESERTQYRDQSLELSKKLAKTREGFSFLLRNTNGKLQLADEKRSATENEHKETLSRLHGLESELDSLREDFERMEMDYRTKLKEADRTIKRGQKTEQTMNEDLLAAQDQLKDQKADLVKLESALAALEAEKDATVEDWQERVVSLQSTNQKLVSNSAELDTLESRIKSSKSEIKELKAERAQLKKDTEGLRTEREELAVAKAQIDEERTQHNLSMGRMKDESQQASLKLDGILQNLHESEKKVTYLRNLENELEKSVLRAQRSALSRKGIYSEDDEALTTIWPETEQLICRELIDRLELLEDLLQRYQQNWFFPKIADQLNLLRDSFMALLKNHSVDQFDLEPGTELSVESRKKIQLISVDDLEDPKLKRLSTQLNENDSRTKVLQTIRPGYIYSKGGQDVIIRKAEVIVA